MSRDAFEELAPFYDEIMDHVDYDRWHFVTTSVATLLPKDFLHLDLACGTGTLFNRLRTEGWRSVGADLSTAMLRTGRKKHGAIPLANADLRALPFQASVDYVTCLFDSINFLLSPDDLELTFREISNALRPGGLLYFDVVTERMVTQHFEGQEWTERNGNFSTTWKSVYDRRNLVAETAVRVNNGPSGTVLERIYSIEEIEAALKQAGLGVLGGFDAHSWRAPGRRTVRVDFVAVKGNPRPLHKAFARVYSKVQEYLFTG